MSYRYGMLMSIEKYKGLVPLKHFWLSFRGNQPWNLSTGDKASLLASRLRLILGGLSWAWLVWSKSWLFKTYRASTLCSAARRLPSAHQNRVPIFFGKTNGCQWLVYRIHMFFCLFHWSGSSHLAMEKFYHKMAWKNPPFLGMSQLWTSILPSNEKKTPLTLW